jgi:hypothetical protein
MALERELETFQRLHDELVQHEGRYALIAGDKLLGIFESHSDALQAGYAARGMQPFLVKKVSAIEVIAHFSRDLRAPCIAPLP